MKKAVFILASLMLTISAFAVLPPLYHSSAEIKRILEDKRFGEKLASGELVLDIKKVEGGWLVTTQSHEMKVNVIYLPNTMPGPAQFDLDFQDPVEINSINS